jgi:hypothetical protein
MLDNAQRMALYTWLTTSAPQFVQDMIIAPVDLANYLNGASAQVVWNEKVSINKIKSDIIWANFTPQDVPDATLLWSARAQVCRLKQANIDILIRNDDGTGFVDATKPGIRGGFQDALTAIPAGASGASKSGGWAAVKLQLQRFATKLEELFLTGTGDSTTPTNLVFIGFTDYVELSNIINLQGAPNNG